MAKNKNYDKKIFRLVSILNKLNGGGKVRSSQLAEEFNVSIRSVQRDLDLLNMTGFPLDMQEKGVYSFMSGFSLRKLMLTDEEASLLSFFHEIANSLGKNFSESFRSLVSKVLAKEDSSPFFVKLPGIPAHMKNFPFVKELEQAVQESQKILIKYESAKGLREHQLCPLKLVNFEGFWYLLAMPEGKRQFRKFRSEKIKALEVLDETFNPPRNLKTALERSVNIWFSEEPGEKILLEIDKDAAHYFKKKIYFPEQRIIKEKKDATLILQTQANHNEVLRTIIQWIPDIRVIQPKELDVKIKGLLKEYLKGSKPRWG
ncbi:MAG TPA: YafY family protein [Candidatus Omnitrophota bacterium]|nr:YafY family protein [Candidatus Omnitrophota bacterium]